MNKTLSSLALAAASLLSVCVAVPAHGAQKTYTNPILNLDYSDPDVVAVGDDFYMTASSFVNAPALPILHSKDLVNWTIVNYALPAVEPLDHYSVPQHGCGVWAPSIRHHNGEFYIYWGRSRLWRVYGEDQRSARRMGKTCAGVSCQGHHRHHSAVGSRTARLIL